MTELDIIEQLIAAIETLYYRNNRLILEARDKLQKINISGTDKAAIAVIGEFSAGKSTFINALIKEDLLEMRVRPTTSVVTTIKYGSERKYNLVFQNDDDLQEYRIPAEMGSISLNNFFEAAGIALSEEIVNIVIELSSEIVRYIEITDTPGFNSGNEKHTEATIRFIKSSDVIFWVFDANRIGKYTEFELLKKYCRDFTIVAIVNKIDQLDQRISLQECKQFFDEFAKQAEINFARIFYVSAINGLQGTREKVVTSGIPQVLFFLSNEILPLVQGLRRKENFLQFTQVLKNIYVLHNWLIQEHKRNTFNSRIIKKDNEFVTHDMRLIENLIFDLLNNGINYYLNKMGMSCYKSPVPNNISDLYQFIYSHFHL